MFTDRQLKKLIIPLVIEQFLAVTIGMADTMMVASCGEAAVSGISIVDAVSILILGLFGAMAAGGSVVAAQYIGSGKKEEVGRAANQLFLAVGGLALVMTVIALVWNRQIIELIYGNLDADVMENARIYFYLSALSYFFIAIYSGGAALFRAVGNSKVSMQTALAVNILNVLGNALFIFGFDMGVAGAGLSTLISRIAAAVLICLCLKYKGDVPVARGLRMDKAMMRKILFIGIPNGLENSIFQVGKLILGGLTASFGTVAITANAVTGNIAGFQLIPAGAIGMAMITVVGQCVGAGEAKQAKTYLWKLLRMAYVWTAAVGAVLFLLAGPVCGLYRLSEETTNLTVLLLTMHIVGASILHPSSFALSNGLRAANDVKFTMYVSIGSMWICRIILAYVLALYLEMGVTGIWIAMIIDWGVRAVFFLGRVISGKWESHMGFVREK